MKSLLRLTDFTKEEILEIFKIADALQMGGYAGFLQGKTVVMFFPSTSIRTRVTFEKGIVQLKGQPILFPLEALDKKEEIKDVAGYLGNWADVIIVRHNDIRIMEDLDTYSGVPVINAMTDINHPCEMIGDMYSLSKIRRDFLKDNYLFCGGKGNIGLAFQEASKVMGFLLSQCCPKGFEMEDVVTYHDVETAVKGKDIICTDSIPGEDLEAFKGYEITEALMKKANMGAILNPCPPFYRNEEVSDRVIESGYFVGYGFKKYLLEIQQAVIIYCLTH